MAVDERPFAPRYEDLIPLPGMAGGLEAMAMYAGRSVELVRDVRPAEDVVGDLTAQAIEVIERMRTIIRSTEDGESRGRCTSPADPV